MTELFTTKISTTRLVVIVSIAGDRLWTLLTPNTVDEPTEDMANVHASEVAKSFYVAFFPIRLASMFTNTASS